MLNIWFPGSNTHNNGAPGGDGQTGNDGEGKAGKMFSEIKSLVEPNLYF